MGRKKSAAELSRFLVTRGLWLVILELTLFRCLGFQFNFDYHITMLIILWALGWAMITLGCLVWLPASAVAAIGLAMIACHNLFDSITPGSLGAFGPFWTMLHGQGFVIGPPHVIFAAYALIPWVGVTAAGYGLGQIFEWAPDRRRAFLLRTGAALVAGFLLLRFANVYGDPAPWTMRTAGWRTVLSFLNATKYPPSLLYLLMTLGPALLILWVMDGGFASILGPALVFGRVPLFYFLLHMPLIHLLAVIVCQARYGQVHWMFESPDLANYPFTRPPGWGYSLPIVYLIWIAVVVGLYPLCAWFAELKRRRTDVWLSYI